MTSMGVNRPKIEEREIDHLTIGDVILNEHGQEFTVFRWVFTEDQFGQPGRGVLVYADNEYAQHWTLGPDPSTTVRVRVREEDR